jgi:outer membrane protein assembly factor BamB
MISLFLSVAIAGPVQAPNPPYRRIETTTLFPDRYFTGFAVRGSTLYAGQDKNCYAYNLVSMKRLWSFTPDSEESIMGLALGANRVYVACGPEYKKTKADLICLNAATGKRVWRLPRSTRSQVVKFRDGVVYTSLEQGTVSAISAVNHHVIWTAKLPRSNNLGIVNVDSILVEPQGIAVSCGPITSGIDPSTGRVTWQHSGEQTFGDSLIGTQGIVLVRGSPGSVALDILSGRERWRSAAGGDASTIFGTRIAVLGDGEVSVIDPMTGRVSWSHRVGDSDSLGGVGQLCVAFGNKLFVSGTSRSVIYDMAGREIFSASIPVGFAKPIWTNGVVLATFDDHQVMRYVHGSATTALISPAKRRRLAERLASNFFLLDNFDKKRLEDLGPDAFEPLLRAYIATCAHYNSLPEEKSLPVYERLESMGDILEKVAGTANVESIIRALAHERTGSTAASVLLKLLAKYGDPKVVTPYFLRELDGVPPPSFETYDSTTYIARSYLANSKDPRAVAFMIKKLNDPKAETELRFQAYVNLARTGGHIGLQAVLAIRNHRKTLRPLEQRVVDGYLGAGEFGTRMKVLSEKTDSSGRKWGLLESGVLGNQGDLWLAEKIDGKWVHPLFAGVSRGAGRLGLGTTQEKKIDGMTAAQLVDGAWFDVLVQNPEIRKDSDGDGLTDLEEERLGTDPHKADTDGDGDSDDVDPWPTVSGRATTDLQKVLAATFEARYHFDESEGPAIVSLPEQVTPFEMPGRRGPTFWEPETTHMNTDELSINYERGIGFIGFHSEGESKGKNWEDHIVTWNKNRTEAKLIISTYFGGLNGTGYRAVVRKFGNDWVVVSMEEAYIS